jgi:hypothetical protein
VPLSTRVVILHRTRLQRVAATILARQYVNVNRDKFGQRDASACEVQEVLFCSFTRTDGKKAEVLVDLVFYGCLHEPKCPCISHYTNLNRTSLQIDQTDVYVELAFKLGNAC